MLVETSNPRDSYYSSLFDEYMASSPRDPNPPSTSPTWGHVTNSVRRRPSLNLHPRNGSISSLKRQPSFDCPSPAPSAIFTPSNRSSQLTSMFNYTASGHFPQSPGYIFSLYSSYNNPGRDSIGSNEERPVSLMVPQQLQKGNEGRASSPSSIYEDPPNDGNTRPSSSSSYDDVNNVPIETPTKNTPSQSDSISINRSSSVKQKNDQDRDRYGFRRSYQWITHKEYSEFESSYNPVLQRRKLKWDTVLNENGGQIPGRTSKMKRYVRKGVPPSLRGRVWFHYSGAEKKMRDHSDLYRQLLLKAQDPRLENEYFEVIERDLHRTFPENIRFKATVVTDNGNSTMVSTDNIPIIQSLRRVLTAFSLYSPNIGYCQSLNYVAGILLLFMEEEKAFWTLVTIIHDYLPENMYDITMEGSNVDQAVLMMFIMEKMPSLWGKLSGGFGWDVEKLDGNMPTITLVTSHWFLTLFINILPIETLLRVWDCFFYEGNKVLFRVALAIFKLNEEKILAVDDPMEIFQVVQNMPKRLVDCHKLIDVCFRRRKGVSDISQKEIDRRREFFRERRKKRVGVAMGKN
ncbi:3784_t:CDS:2 [Acaulospora morrowiae]|uniref:3784_t:CDS:1 n=1 Tax=Acaulospora morrowiae TaxID=94023 RepID=A0A9N9EEE7_9GLOM|nr:3784_t:CDS:2 [Acaulospora morrowiae]